MGYKILSVNDEGIFHKGWIEQGGNTIFHFSLGCEARRAIEGGLEYDLAMIDLSLPDCDGADLIKELKRMFPKKPVICCSGYLDTASAADGKLVTGSANYIDLESMINKFLPGAIKKREYF